MDQKEIYDLISRFEESPLTCLEIEQDHQKIHMEKGNATAGQPVYQMPVAATEAMPGQKAGTQAEATLGEQVKAPIVGVYYAAPSPEDAPYVSIGDKVEKGQVLCLIEAMKMMNEMKSPVTGIVRKIGGINGELVEFGQVLFEVEPC